MTRTLPYSVAVYCSSSNDIPPKFLTLAQQVGQALAEQKLTLIYGGGSVGMMGEVARSVHQFQGQVVGVIPEFMQEMELAYKVADELVVTRDMRARKAIMEQRADGFLVLPGGFGTLDELFEIMTLRLLGRHAKPLVILNTDGFYQSLLTFMDELYAQRFARARTRAHFHIAANIPDALSYLQKEWSTPTPTA